MSCCPSNAIESVNPKAKGRAGGRRGYCLYHIRDKNESLTPLSSPHLTSTSIHLAEQAASHSGRHLRCFRELVLILNGTFKISRMVNSGHSCKQRNLTIEHNTQIRRLHYANKNVQPSCLYHMSRASCMIEFALADVCKTA